MRRPAVLLLALLPLVLPAPAEAKGATDVVVTGPGIERVHLGYQRSAQGVSFEDLTEATQVYGIFGDQFTIRPDLTAAELGPAYELRWKVGRDPMMVSRVYPFAEGGAWAFVPRGQETWEVRLEGGWWRGGDELEALMVALGADAAAPYVSGTSTSLEDVVRQAAVALARGARACVHGTLPA